MPPLWKQSAAFILILAVSAAAAERSKFDVTTHGAAGDGKTLDTAAIQRAIEACHASGGGIVVLPTGRFVSGTLELRSNVTLHLSPGAVLLGSGDPADYPLKHLIYAKDAEHIGIEGGGVIDGRSPLFFDADMKPLEMRPSPLVELVGCKDVRIEGVTIRNAPAWTLRPKNCDGMKILGISILNDLRAINSDGIDVDSSRNVVIANCHIEAGDDCIVLKTTDHGGPPTPTENVVVTNCVLVSSASALKLGTESIGDFRHILFSNCVIRDSRTGIALMAKDGGTMEAIHFSNITITTKQKWGRGHEWPIHIDSEQRADDSKLSPIRDVSLSDITIHTRGRVIAQGQAGMPIDGLVFRNVTMRITGPEDITGAHKVTGGKSYTDNVLDLGDKPAAFILGEIKGLVLDGVTVHWPEELPSPARHAAYGFKLDGADLRGLRGGASQPDLPAVVLEQSRNVRE